MMIKDIIFICHTCKYDRPKHDLKIEHPLESTTSFSLALEHIQEYPNHDINLFFDKHEEED